MARAKKSSGVKVNFKGVESRKTPAEGDYKMTVLEANAGKSSSTGNDQIEFICEIAAGEYKGVKAWLYCPLADNSLWKLHAFLTALGQEVPEEEMDIDLSDLIGSEFVGVMSHETYNGKKRAKLTDFDSLDNYKGEADSDEDEKPKKDKKKDKKSKDEPAAEEPKKGKRDKGDKKSKKDEPADEPAKGKKDKKEKGGKDKAPKKFDKDDIEDMDEDELADVIKASGIKVDLKSIKKLPKKVAAVIEALEEADLLEE